MELWKADMEPTGCPARGTPYFTEIPTATTPTTIDPNQNSYNDYLSANKWFDFDGLYTNSTMKPADPKTLNPILNGFKVNSELPDPEGKGVIGVDPAGRPILQSLIGSNFFDLPYELNLGQQAGRGLTKVQTLHQTIPLALMNWSEFCGHTIVTRHNCPLVWRH